jgi:hypothetical protein
MTNFLLFNFFSTLENIGIIVLLLSIFKYRVFDYTPQILLTSLIMSMISHTMRFEFNHSNFVPLMIIFSLFLFIWIAFRVSFYYALIITVVGFIASSLLQAILLYSLQFIGVLSLKTVEIPYSLEGYMLQATTVLVSFFISFVLRRKNIGFNWVPYSRTAKFTLKGDNIILFIVTITSVFAIGLLFYLYLSGDLKIVAISILFLILLTLLFYLSGKQEEKYYD